MAQGPDEVRERSPQEEEGAPEATPAASEETKERAQSGDEVAATRAKVEQTRAEMSETVDAIQERFEPPNLKEQASTVARGAGTELLEAIRNNPAPVAIGGLALVGLVLLAQGLQGQGRRRSTGVVIDLRRREVRGA